MNERGSEEGALWDFHPRVEMASVSIGNRVAVRSEMINF